MIPTLRNYQEGQLDAIAESLLADVNRVLIKSPTGTGKTVTFAALLEWPRLKSWLGQFPAGERRMLVIAHREELLEQAAEKIRRANPGLLVAIEQADRRASVHVDVVVASIQTLAAVGLRRLDRLLRRMTFRVVIVDEAHHAAARTYRQVLARLGFLPSLDANGAGTTLDVEAAAESDVDEMRRELAGWDRIAAKDQVLVGFTATPNRSDAVGLGCVFQSIAYSYALKDAIRDGWLVPPVPWAIETDTTLDDVRVNRGEFNQRELADAVNTESRNALALAGWRERAEGRATLGFTVDVAHAHALAELWQQHGYRALALSGETPKDERRIALRQFQAGQVDQIFNCQLLTEGTDLPRVSCILHAKPTKSATLYEQMTGRGLRLFEGKTDCVLIDLVDVSRRHSLMTAPVLYGLPPSLVAEGKSLAQLEDEFAAMREAFPRVDLDELLSDHLPLTLEALRARAVAVDPWRVPDLGAFGQGRTLQWLRVGADEFQVEYPWTDAAGVDGTERLTVAKDLLDRWDVSLTWIERVAGPFRRKAERRQTTIAAQIVTADAAAGVAEAFVLTHRRSAARIVSNAAPWRQRPATPNQVALLARLRVPHADTITAGEASQLIDSRMARRR